jgi:hypothetical protein
LNLKLGSGHQTALYKINDALFLYAGENKYSILPLKFDIHFPPPDKGRCLLYKGQRQRSQALPAFGLALSQASSWDQADQAIYNFPFGNETRSSHLSVIFEIELTHRSLAAAHQHCIEYFQLIPALQAVILLKFDPRSKADRSNQSFYVSKASKYVRRVCRGRCQLWHCTCQR